MVQQLGVQIGRINPNPTRDKPELWFSRARLISGWDGHGLGIANLKKVRVDLSGNPTQPEAELLTYSIHMLYITL